ncbi:MAG: vWA domain-containing protein [Myxococcaceae bacterium]
MNPWRFELLGYPMGLARPAFLLLTLVAAGLAVAGVLFARKQRTRIQALLAPHFAGRLTPGVSNTRPLVKALLTTAGLFFFAVALAQPQCGSTRELSKRRGIDVVVALDASKSMLARDVQPDRLERAKLELMTLLDELKGDRVAIIAFAGDAFIQCPLTSDYAAAKMFLRAIDPDQMQQGGSNLGAALILSKQVLESAQRGSADRVVVLISDGEDLGGESDEAVDALKDAGIRVFAVGIGSEQGEPIPIVGKRGEILGYKKDETGETVMTRLDRAGLNRIAQGTEGEFFYEPRAVAMGDVVRRIDQLQKSELESRLTVRYDERYQDFAVSGFVLLVLGLLVRPSRRTSRAAAASALLFVLWAPSAHALGPFEKNHPKVDEGTAAYEAGRYEEALKAFDEAKRALPSSAAVEFNRGNALFRLGRHEEARAAFERAQETDKGSLKQKAYYNLGNTLAQLNKAKEAIAAYRKALLMDPKDRDARHNLEVVLRKLPPPSPSSPDGGTDGGGGDGGSDGGSDAGGPPQASDGGQGDGGQGDGGSPQSKAKMDGGGQGDGGMPDGGSDAGENSGRGDGQPEKGDAGANDPGNEDERDGGEAETRDGGEGAEARISKEEAEKLLDSMKQNEKNLQLWRFQQKKKRKSNAKDW